LGEEKIGDTPKTPAGEYLLHLYIINGKFPLFLEEGVRGCYFLKLLPSHFAGRRPG